MSFLDLSLFLTATFGHLALVPYWLQRWYDRFSSREEFLFYAIVFGFGSLQAVLHILACTIGLSLTAGVVSLLLVHVALYVWRPVRQTQAPHARVETAAVALRELTASAVAITGIAGVVGCVLTWLYRSSQSLQILGIDSTHYHAPYAINYAHGVSLFGFAATPHLYPMGASILGAWFFQALDSPLWLDLTNLLPFLLLFASLAYLFTLLTDNPGFDWAPLVFLLLFTGRLFRVSLFISADLFYCATCVALFTMLCSFCFRDRIESHEWLALGLVVGILLSSKPQGMLSAAVLIGVAAVALVLRRLAARKPVPGGLRPSFTIVVGLCALTLGAGGIWLLRSWFRFGSPMAPAGLSLLGITIFPGPPGRSADAPLSLLAELHGKPGYDVWGRFRFFTIEWVGTWPAWFAAAPLVLMGDIIYQLSTRRRLTPGTQHRVFALLLLVGAFAVHAYVLAGVAFSGMEWLQGQTLRFILPFYALYPIVMLALLFPDSLPWLGRGHLKWLALAGLVFLLADYNRLTAMPAQWNRLYGVEDMLDLRLLPLAMLIVIPWFVRGAPWHRYATYACAAVVTTFCLVLVHYSVTQADQLAGRESTQFERQLARFQRDGVASTEYRGVLYRPVIYQRQQHLRCTHSRFFTVSRFDFPVDLQDPSCSNVVFDVQNEVTRVAPLLHTDGPGQGSCDFVVAVHTTATDKGTTYAAVTDAEINTLLTPRGTLQPIGDSGRYRVYYVRP